MRVEVVLDAGARIGESPTWAAEQRMLYWIDVKAPALHRFDPASGDDRRWRLPADVGAFALTTDLGTAIVALRDGIYRLDLAGGGLDRLADAPFDTRLHRFNEGACDSRGRFWVGTMFDPLVPDEQPAQAASLFRYTCSRGLVAAGDAASLHNGMGWNRDESLFYLSHSYAGTVHAYPFDAEAGELGGRRLFAVIEPGAGIPDGAAVDAEGGYWCALHGGGRLRRYRADGTLDREVRLPVSQPTMCAFGGDALDILYVTSAAQGREDEPHAGAILALRPGLRGLERPQRFRFDA